MLRELRKQGLAGGFSLYVRFCLKLFRNAWRQRFPDLDLIIENDPSTTSGKIDLVLGNVDARMTGLQDGSIRDLGCHLVADDFKHHPVPNIELDVELARGERPILVVLQLCVLVLLQGQALAGAYGEPADVPRPRLERTVVEPEVSTRQPIGQLESKEHDAIVRLYQQSAARGASAVALVPLRNLLLLVFLSGRFPPERAVHNLPARAVQALPFSWDFSLVEIALEDQVPCLADHGFEIGLHLFRPEPTNAT
jgi:hypothetical protein